MRPEDAERFYEEDEEADLLWDRFYNEEEIPENLLGHFLSLFASGLMLVDMIMHPEQVLDVVKMFSANTDIHTFINPDDVVFMNIREPHTKIHTSHESYVAFIEAVKRGEYDFEEAGRSPAILHEDDNGRAMRGDPPAHGELPSDAT